MEKSDSDKLKDNIMFVYNRFILSGMKLFCLERTRSFFFDITDCTLRFGKYYFDYDYLMRGSFRYYITSPLKDERFVTRRFDELKTSGVIFVRRKGLKRQYIINLPAILNHLLDIYQLSHHEEDSYLEYKRIYHVLRKHYQEEYGAFPEKITLEERGALIMKVQDVMEQAKERSKKEKGEKMKKLREKPDEQLKWYDVKELLREYCEEFGNIYSEPAWTMKAKGQVKQWLEKQKDAKETLYKICKYWWEFRDDGIKTKYGNDVRLSVMPTFEHIYMHRNAIADWIAGRETGHIAPKTKREMLITGDPEGVAEYYRNSGKPIPIDVMRKLKQQKENNNGG